MRFFPRKKTLVDIMPEDYMDIHSHILPGLDDGSKSIQDSIFLLEELHSVGCKNIIATPHIMSGVWENNVETIFEAYCSLKDHLPTHLQGMLYGFAAEYMVDYELSRKIVSEELLTFGNKCILIEFSFLEAPKTMFEVIQLLKEKHFQIILAHPERYAYYHKHFYLYEELKNYDIYFQINLLSTIGYYGGKIAQVADELLSKDYIDFTGSDIHHKGHIKAFEKPLKIKNKEKLLLAMRNNSTFFTSHNTHSLKNQNKG